MAALLPLSVVCAHAPHAECRAGIVRGTGLTRTRTNCLSRGVDMRSAFSFLPLEPRPPKPRTRGITAMRGPYYSPLGPHYFEDLLAAVGDRIDLLKYAGGSFAIMETASVRRLNDIAHQHKVAVSTGGFIERVIAWGDQHVEPYLRVCRALHFDIVEVSSGFLSMADDDFVRLIERVMAAGLRVIAEVGIQHGAGGGSTPAALARAGTFDPELAIRRAARALEAGADLIMLESEGITEQVPEWRTAVIDLFVQRIGLEKLLFEAAEPRVFEWYVRTFGRDVNLFVDHSQVVQLEVLRAGAWGTVETWGKVR
ncbi:MAG: phosphosulfolactate synthase [Gemmatimonadota bacterium]